MLKTRKSGFMKNSKVGEHETKYRMKFVHCCVATARIRFQGLFLRIEIQVRTSRTC